MQTLDAKRIEALTSELELILISTADVTDQFNALSRFFYKLVKTGTNEEPIAFRNFYARFKYLLSQLRLTEKERQNTDAFRRFIKRGNQKQASPHTIKNALSLLAKLLVLLAGKKNGMKPAFRELPYSDQYFTGFFPKIKYEERKNLKVLCASWKDEPEENETEAFILNAYDLENLETAIEVVIKKHPYADFTTIKPLLTENAILQLQYVKFTGKAENQYTTTPDSLIVLEPDFLVEATAIGECFSNYGSNSDIYFLSKLIEDSKGTPALKGGIIGYYLDEILRNNDHCLDTLFRAAQRINALKAARFGSQEMKEIKRSIETDHLRNMQLLADKKEGKEIWIEPTYFSREYGLQGRLDVLEVDKQLNTRDIVELKSGKPSDPDRIIAWANHKMQLVSYDMLLQSTYGANRQGANHIYYSQCPIQPQRNIVSEHDEKVYAMKIRNEIVAKIYRLAASDFSQLQRIKDHGITSLPKFNEMELALFQRLYEPEKIPSQYYQELMAFTLREMINAKVGDLKKEDEEEGQQGFAGLWLDDLTVKEKDFRIIYDLRVEVIDERHGIVTLSFDSRISHCFRKGDLVILYPKTNDEYYALAQHILKGSVNEVHNDRIVISLFNLQTNYSFIEEHTHWAIEEDIFERNFWSTISILANVLSCTDRKKRLLFGHIAPEFTTTAVYKNKELTTRQNLVIGKALNAKDYFLLQGPPGTGKTSTFLVHYVKETLHTTNDKMVVLAFTNKAVEKICESFKRPRNGAAPIEYMRLGSKHVEDTNLFTSLIHGDNPDNWRQLINHHRVFVTTVATFHNNWLLLKDLVPFKQVVIDEASQLTEAAMAGILVLFDKFILIGDDKQLPSVVTQDAKTCLAKSEYLNKLGVTDFRMSLFERLTKNAEKKQWHNAYDQLTDHYRMHQEIASLITKHYRNELIAGLDKQKSTAAPYLLPASHLLYPLSHNRTVFVESPCDTGIKKNRQEALVAATIVRELIETGIVEPGQIGIITPFRAQIAEIKKYIPLNILNDRDFIIDTVERYQGDERRIIIFSTTVTSARQAFALQSVSDNDEMKTDRKLLVSISRASDQLIVLGNSEALGAAKAYRELIDIIHANKGYIGVDFANAIIQSKNEPEAVQEV